MGRVVATTTDRDAGAGGPGPFVKRVVALRPTRREQSCRRLRGRTRGSSERGLRWVQLSPRRYRRSGRAHHPLDDGVSVGEDAGEYRQQGGSVAGLCRLSGFPRGYKRRRTAAVDDVRREHRQWRGADPSRITSAPQLGTWVHPAGAYDQTCGQMGVCQRRVAGQRGMEPHREAQRPIPPRIGQMRWSLTPDADRWNGQHSEVQVTSGSTRVKSAALR